MEIASMSDAIALLIKILVGFFAIAVWFAYVSRKS